MVHQILRHQRINLPLPQAVDVHGFARSKVNQALRALGFAHIVYLFTIFALLPNFRTSVNFAILIWGFLCVWMGAATAHRTRGWRTLVLPLVVMLVYVVGTAIVGVLLAGAEFTFQAVITELGLNN